MPIHTSTASPSSSSSSRTNTIQVYNTPSEASPKTFDFIICCHKAIKPASTPPLFHSITNESTTFVIIQNGVGNEIPFRQTYPNNSIISCVTWSGCVQSTPGTISHNSNENIQIGLFHNSRIHSQTEYNRLTTFSELLKNGETKFSIEDNIQIARWEKVRSTQLNIFNLQLLTHTLLCYYR